jgi:hypothetical protein
LRSFHPRCIENTDPQRSSRIRGQWHFWNNNHRKSPHQRRTKRKSFKKIGPDRIWATSLEATCGGPDKQKEKPLCLNAWVCRERHFLKDCPITSDADKEELLAKYRAEQVTAGGARQTRSTTKAGYISSKRLGVNTDEILADIKSTPEGRFMVTFPCGYTSLCLPDNGSDDNILPRSVLDA